MNYQILVLFIIMALGLRRKMFNRRRLDAGMPDAAPSPFSRALTELLAAAGGIYLSLMLLVQFLSVDIPSQIDIIGLEIDPLALVAVLIASLQPFFVNSKFLKKW